MQIVELKRDVPFSLKFNAKEREALNQIALVLGRQPQEVIRELIRAEAMRLSVWDNAPVPA